MIKRYLKKYNLLLKEAFFCMLFAYLVLGVILFIGINLSFFSPFKNAFKDFSYLDLYYSEKLGNDSSKISKDIILVNIDRLNRKEIALLMQKLQENQPKVIGLDLIFKDLEDPIWDQFLAQNVMNENIVSAYVLGSKRSIKSNKNILSEKLIAGYTNFNFDNSSAVVRNFQGTVNRNDSLYFAFATQVAKKYLGTNWSSALERKISKPIPINYYGNRDDFLVLEYTDIVEYELLPIIKDKIVLIGYLGSQENHNYDIEDKHFTPMNLKFVGKSPPDMFGILVHANIIKMLIEQDFIKVVPNWFVIMLTVILTYLALCYFIWLNKKQLASYILRLNFMQLLFIVCFVWISLSLFKRGILFKTASITAVMVSSIGLIGFYKKIAHYLYKKFKWEGYFFQG